MEPRSYLLGAGTEERPRELDGLKTKVVRRIPDPPGEPAHVPGTRRELESGLAVPKALRMSADDERRRRDLNDAAPRLHESSAVAAAQCGNHEAIGTVIDGMPLQPHDTVGTWVSMPIFKAGIPGLSGWMYTTFSNIAAQTLEVLGAYAGGGLAQLAVFDWSCVDGKQGTPECDEAGAWVYAKDLGDLGSKYTFSYWDGCGWQKALALANTSRALLIHVDAPLLRGLTSTLPLYVNEAKILNWDTLEWETFYARVYLERDAQPPRPWGPLAFVEFISDAGCPALPRLGFREVRLLPPGGSWTLATPDNSSFRFDLPTVYRYGLFDPNHTFAISKT